MFFKKRYSITPPGALETVDFNEWYNQFKKTRDYHLLKKHLNQRLETVEYSRLCSLIIKTFVKQVMGDIKTNDSFTKEEKKIIIKFLNKYKNIKAEIVF